MFFGGQPEFARIQHVLRTLARFTQSMTGANIEEERLVKQRLLLDARKTKWRCEDPRVDLILIQAFDDAFRGHFFNRELNPGITDCEFPKKERHEVRGNCGKDAKP